MKSVAIVGAYGFIGGHLSTRYKNHKKFGRQNIMDLESDNSDITIVAAAPATKWIANAEPEKDLMNIKNLIYSLRTIQRRKCVLISTIDVFPTNYEFDEDSVVLTNHEEAYGANRSYLETELANFLEDLHIIRLPGMYGPGLKKNLIFDLANKKEPPKLNPSSTFQFYDVRSLPGHIELCLDNDVKVLNLATEPVSVKEIYFDCFGLKPINS